MVVDASRNGGVRGTALPMKLDLARRTSLLHAEEIVGTSFDDAADQMMNSAKRSAMAAHPFFVADPNDRKAVIEFMKSLGTSAPGFTAAGVANEASFMSGAVAPGEVIAISGTALGVGMAQASMSNTTVKFDGVAATLVSVTTTQITALVPFDVAGKSTTQLVVTANGQSAPALALSVIPAMPGIFTMNGAGSGQAAVLNQDGTLNSASNPAAKGSVVAIYMTGGGQTNPAGVNGAIVGGTLPLLTGQVSATIGGSTAIVAYAGGAQGLYAGVSQINLVVPSGAASGSDALTINVGGTTSQAGVTVAVK